MNELKRGDISFSWEFKLKTTLQKETWGQFSLICADMDSKCESVWAWGKVEGTWRHEFTHIEKEIFFFYYDMLWSCTRWIKDKKTRTDDLGKEIRKSFASQHDRDKLFFFVLKNGHLFCSENRRIAGQVMTADYRLRATASSVTLKLFLNLYQSQKDRTTDCRSHSWSWCCVQCSCSKHVIPEDTPGESF